MSTIVAPRRLCLLLTAVAGCAPLSHAGRARTLDPGRNEITAGPEVAIVRPSITERGVPLPSLQLTIGYRRGITDSLELGGRIWGLAISEVELRTRGAALDGKWQLRRDGRDGAQADLTVAPSVAYHQASLGGTPQHFALVSLPLLFGLRVGARNQFVFGPRVVWQVWWGESQQAQRHLFYGGSVAFAWAIGQRWSFVPELVALWSPISFGGEVPRDYQKGVSQLALGLGVGVGF